MREEPIQEKGASLALIEKFRQWSLLKLTIGILLLLALMSHSETDPAPLNLLSAPQGISNWMSYPGALTAGFLLLLFGKLSYVLPLRMMFLTRRHQVSLINKVFFDGMTLAALTICFALLCPVHISITDFCGVMGFGAVTSLSVFPGKLIALLIGFGWLIRFINEYKINKTIITVLMLIVSTVVSFFIYILSFLAIQIRRIKKSLQKTYHDTLAKTVSGLVAKMIAPIRSSLAKYSSDKAEKARVHRRQALNAPIISVIKSQKAFSRLSLERYVSREVLNFENREDIRDAARGFNELLEQGKVKV